MAGKPFTSGQPNSSLVGPHEPVFYRMEIIATGNFHQLSGTTCVTIQILSVKERYGPFYGGLTIHCECPPKE